MHGMKDTEWTGKEARYLKRRVLEAIWIKKTSRNLNLDCGLASN